MKEIVVISGKGGTGKTSITASLAELTENAVFVDCDVDASDLHIILHPEIKEREYFTGGKEYKIDNEKCFQCGTCMSLCRYDAISFSNWSYVIDPYACEGCGVCAYFCTTQAVTGEDKIAGEWFISDTDYGPLVHARLGIGEENSGKLVSKIKEEARSIARQHNKDIILVDGSPGTGCPVIASITGAHNVIIVTEPTVSGFHDLKRVAALLTHFRIPGNICINKFDLNHELSSAIESFALENDLNVVGKIPYDTIFSEAQINGKTIVAYENHTIASLIKKMWKTVLNSL